MGKELKPVSDAMRRVLALLGETPEEHQREQQLRASAKKHALPPPPSLRPANEVVAGWEEDPWRPDARVLFIRHSTCTSCGASFSSPHWPETFIRSRRKGDHKGMNSYKYTPARSYIASSIPLPHILEQLNLTVRACHLCPDWQESQLPQESSQCLQDLMLSHAATSGSKRSGSDQILNISSVGAPGSWSLNLVRLNSTPLDLENTDISSFKFGKDSPCFGGNLFGSPSGFNSSDFAPTIKPAGAEPINSPTLEAAEIVSSSEVKSSAET